MNVTDGPASAPLRGNRALCYAYFPGSGPENTVCFDCKFADPSRANAWDFPPNGIRCTKYAQLTHTPIMKCGKVPSKSESCKYFDPVTVQEGQK